ncbi:MAG: bifunctional (p)ppGpp synthetase/guanosine-3',5'-bis(diphosphate) 3'-pyrophosphohydrolase, partial [Bacteroidales bacterium]|nr:bifunctional (p)ppGpp synthetase/guanosine-3',5'-bis(diphosphate) 3'-pyrophosphohydrolase [Bacteroidales bacterium]
PLKDKLDSLGFKYEIKGRTKSIHSIMLKMKKQGVEFDEVYDLFAVRIIIDSEQENEKADCWRVYSVVTDLYQPNPSRLRDWISVPKSNGYESLHTTVVGPRGKWVEVQIRSSRMDEIAEKGLAAHYKYKGIKGEGGLDVWLGKMRDILESTEKEGDAFSIRYGRVYILTRSLSLLPRATCVSFPRVQPFWISHSISTRTWALHAWEERLTDAM